MTSVNGAGIVLEYRFRDSIRSPDRAMDVAPTLPSPSRIAAQPSRRRSWLGTLPGETQGHKLLYRRQENQELARATQTIFMSGE
jgi:hypothetical protein